MEICIDFDGTCVTHEYPKVGKQIGAVSVLKELSLLEDEQVLADIYTKNLIFAGFQVKCAKDVEEATIILSDFYPDLAIIDHGIRGQKENGLNFIPKLKKMYPKCKIIMLSNYSHTELREAALKAGAEDFLVKLDYPPRVLPDYVKNLLSE